MIGLFDTEAETQKYCDECSTAHGLPKTTKHPRTGKEIVIAVAWDTPRLHPDGSGRAWCTIDDDQPLPKATIVKELPDDWKPEGPNAKAARMVKDEAKPETDPDTRLKLAALHANLDVDAMKAIEAERAETVEAKR